MEFVGKWEWGNDDDGGFTNDPDDPGGATKFGISQRAHPNENIPNLTIERARELYFKGYWLPYCEGVDWPINIVVFDTAVNGGLRDILSRLPEDFSVQEFLQARRERYLRLIQKNPKLAKYKKGWLNRVNDLAKFIEIIEDQTDY